MQFLKDNPVASLIVVIVAVAGAIVTVTNPDTLPFRDYVESVTLGAGLLAIGRGLDKSRQLETNNR